MSLTNPYDEIPSHMEAGGARVFGRRFRSVGDQEDGSLLWTKCVLGKGPERACNPSLASDVTCNLEEDSHRLCVGSNLISRVQPPEP